MQWAYKTENSFEKRRAEGEKIRKIFHLYILDSLIFMFRTKVSGPHSGYCGEGAHISASRSRQEEVFGAGRAHHRSILLSGIKKASQIKMHEKDAALHDLDPQANLFGSRRRVRSFTYIFFSLIFIFSLFFFVDNVIPQTMLTMGQLYQVYHSTLFALLKC